MAISTGGTMKAHDLVLWMWIAGGIQTAIVLANAALPAKLSVRSGMASAPRFLRQVFVVHWIYVVLTVLLFSFLCFFFARDLAGGGRLGRFLCGAMGVFWGLRLPLQLFYYDADLRRQNRGLDLAYVLALVALIAIFGAATLAPRG
jgi:hypothetical protein